MKKKFYSKEFKDSAVQQNYQRENIKELAAYFLNILSYFLLQVQFFWRVILLNVITIAEYYFLDFYFT